jgi:hypothetical protein
VRPASSLIGFAAILATSVSLAQERDPVAADRLFRDARAAATRADYATACPLFAESLRLDPAAGTMLNLADCEERLGKVASAWEHYQRVADQLPATDERAVISNAHIVSLEKRLPKLTVKLASDTPPQAKVTRDGIELGAVSLGRSLPVDPGEHVVVVTVAGHKEKRTLVTLVEAQTLEVTVGAGAREATPKPTASTTRAVPETVPTATRSRTAGYVVLAGGGAALVVGAVTGLLVFRAKSTVEEHCGSDKLCDSHGVDAAGSGKTMSTVSTIMFAVAGVTTGVGIYWVLGGDSKPKMAVGPAATRGGGGLAFAGCF